MSTSVDRLSEEALLLTMQERVLLATRILESMDSTEEQDVEAFAAEYEHAEIRLAEIDSGSVQTISEDKVHQRVRRRIK